MSKKRTVSGKRGFAKDEESNLCQANVLQSVGKYWEAMEYYDQALMDAIAGGDPHMETTVYTQMANCILSVNIRRQWYVMNRHLWPR